MRASANQSRASSAAAYYKQGNLQRAAADSDPWDCVAGERSWRGNGRAAAGAREYMLISWASGPAWSAARSPPLDGAPIASPIDRDRSRPRRFADRSGRRARDGCCSACRPSDRRAKHRLLRRSRCPSRRPHGLRRHVATARRTPTSFRLPVAPGCAQRTNSASYERRIFPRCCCVKLKIATPPWVTPLQNGAWTRT